MEGGNMTITREVLLIVLGGLFGWMLGKLPDRWVYFVIAAAIILILVVIKS